MPAKGRNVLGNEAFEKIDKFSKKIYEYLLGFNVEKAKRQIKLFENIENLREKLKTNGLKTTEIFDIDNKISSLEQLYDALK